MPSAKIYASVLAVSSLLSGVARAEAIDRGTFALGGERLTGMFHTDEKVGNGPSNGVTTLALLGNGGDISDASSAFMLPRVGLDGFIIDGLSLGGTFIVIHDAPAGDSQTAFVLQPRIGFGFMFSRVVGIWPRGGIGYWNYSGQNDNSGHCFAFNLDVPLIIRPVRHFAITVGPVLDVGFAGKRNLPGPGPDLDVSFTEFGLSAGLVAFL